MRGKAKFEAGTVVSQIHALSPARCLLILLHILMGVWEAEMPSQKLPTPGGPSACWQMERPVTCACSEDLASGYGLVKAVTTSWGFETWVSHLLCLCRDQLLGITEPKLLHL